MMLRHSCRCLIPLLLLCVLYITRRTQGDTNAPVSVAEPPFPLPFGLAGLSAGRRLKIVSESAGNQFAGRKLNEEYIDLVSARAAYRTTQIGYQVVLVHPQQDVAFSYQPYTCTVSSMAEAVVPGATYIKSMIKIDVPNEGQSYNMNLFGVIALWVYASDKNKQFSNEDTIFSYSKDMFARSYRWSVEDKELKININFHFIDVSREASTGVVDGSHDFELALDMIKIESTEDPSKTLLTYNILSLAYALEPNDMEILDIPVGFGCFNVFQNYKWPKDIDPIAFKRSSFWFNWSQFVELEITAVEQGNTIVTAAAQDSCADTQNLELVVLPEAAYTRLRDSHADRKSVIDFGLRVKYNIDLKHGSCALENFGENGLEKPLVSIRFTNGLRMELTMELFDKLFKTNVDFKVVRVTKEDVRTGELGHTYEERTFEKLFGDTDSRSVRVIRSYAYQSDGTSAKRTERQLDSVMVWVMSEAHDRIEESYLINVIRLATRPSAGALRQFDVSEDCYFNDNKKRYGRDYAWLNWHYSVDKSQMQVVRNNVDKMESDFRRSLKEALSLSWIQVPRIELIFDYDGFTLRLLVLDLPGVQYLYAEHKGKMLVEECIVELAPDMDHCSKLCVSHKCFAVSYEPLTKVCHYSTKRISLTDLNRVTLPKQDCSVYLKPDDLSIKLLQSSNLQWIIADAEAQNYEVRSRPKPPDDVIESGDDNDEQTSEAHKKYLKDLLDYWMKFQFEAPKTRLVLDELHTIIRPDGFEVEPDLQYEAYSFDDDHESSVVRDPRTSLAATPAAESFHQGIVMARYNIMDLEMRRNARRFEDLSYDQCALLCLDSSSTEQDSDCGSLSYCVHQRTCIISNLNNTDRARDLNLVEADPDCFIAQRDYLVSFSRIEDTPRPLSYRKKLSGTNPTDCALECLFSSEFRCLGFDYCAGDKDSSVGAEVEESSSAPAGRREGDTCFLQQLRYNPSDTVPRTEPRSSESTPLPDAATAMAPAAAAVAGSSELCDHYTRWYLADFDQFDYQQFAPAVWTQVPSSMYLGKTVIECGDLCAVETSDCIGFEFCFEPAAEVGQTCKIVRGSLNVLLNASLGGSSSTWSSPAGDEATQSSLSTKTRVKRLLKPYINCHVYVLREDSREAHVRFVDRRSSTQEQQQQQQMQLGAPALTIASQSGVSFFGAMLLFVLVSITIATITFGAHLVEERVAQVHLCLDRLRSLVRT